MRERWPKDVEVLESPHGSELYRQSLVLREAILRAPLGLTLTEAERADDVARRHFCATYQGVVVGTVSLKRLDGETLRLHQMAVAEDRRREKIGARLLARAEDWARWEGYRRSCCMPGSAPRASTPDMAIGPRATPSTSTASRISA